MRVEMADLPNEIVTRGPGFLLSSVLDSRPHAVHQYFEVAAEGGQVELRTPVGATARGNVGMRPSVSVLWPPQEPGGFSLIVDGEARLDGDDHVVISVTGAVLHRYAPNGPSSASATNS
jgi:hypothetical protein